MVNILLAEDEQLVRQGLRLMIETAPDLRVTEAADGLEAVALLERRAFDLVILDIRMPGLDGIQAARRIRAQLPEQKILFLTTFNDDDYALQALRLGASGYLLKNADAGQLISAIRSCLTGGMPLGDQVAARLLPRLLQQAEPEPEPGPAALLTPRETTVVQLVGQGHSNAEIAGALGLSAGTVRNVVSAVLDKLELRDRTQLAIYAIRHDLA
jgi:DNA-binding NarL/FixJ family response regulator